MNITGNLLLPSSVACVSSLFHFIEGWCNGNRKQALQAKWTNWKWTTRGWGDCSCRCWIVRLSLNCMTLSHLSNGIAIQKDSNCATRNTIIARFATWISHSIFKCNTMASEHLNQMDYNYTLSESSNVRARQAICDRLLYWIHWYWLFCCVSTANAVQNDWRLR